MTDIVERLRKGWGHADSDTLDDAAIEIEWLRERVAELQAQCGYMESIEAVRLANAGEA